MLRRLRYHLTFLYILVALGLVLLVSAGANFLLGYYFEKQTDLALSYKMAQAYRQYNLALPEELQQAELAYLKDETSQINPPVLAQNSNSGNNGDQEEHEENEDESEHEAQSEPEPEDDKRYDAQLAPIYVLPVDAQGNLLSSPAVADLPFTINQEARQSALQNGSDLRTVHTGADAPTRLLTYRVDSLNGPVFLQVGRSLADQERIRNQFLLGLLGLGAASSILLGLGSWWLSGKSLVPAQKSWDQQVNFVANASHELRTPLTLMRASAEVIQRSHPPVSQDQQQLVSDILAECDYMDQLVTDLLLLSRLDTRRLQLAREPVRLSEILKEVSQQAQKLAWEKNIEVQMGETPGVVWADPARLRQVILILLDNAIRFTPDHGAIRLETICKHKTCLIIVSDNGPGIAPEHLEHIFDRFYQANPTGEGNARSNGLGLSIAKGIVEAQGGKIQVISQPGAGTRVVVELLATALDH